jgi:D-cysteine desulfhydrase family pyridoxal phosphate-dependent enzyme
MRSDREYRWGRAVSSQRVSAFPHVSLAHKRTPLERLDRLSAALKGPAIWIKRDDLTGLAGGGNKARKLDFLVGEAKASGADTLITAGAIQSNHARQVAAAAARFGFDCSLVATDSVPIATAAYRTNGNLLISRLLGARIYEVGNVDSAPIMETISQRLTEDGRKPYVIPVGGSNAVGTLGYVDAFFELDAQFRELRQEFRHIVVASGSGGTQAGLTLAATLAEWPGQINGISVGAERDRQAAKVRIVLNATAVLLNVEDIASRCSIIVDATKAGPSYGVPDHATIESVRLLAETEGLLLDPVYTGKAMAGLIAKVRSGEFKSSDNVVFWHTGGSTALAAYPEYFS